MLVLLTSEASVFFEAFLFFLGLISFSIFSIDLLLVRIAFLVFLRYLGGDVY